MKYRNIPVIIDAIQFDGFNLDDIKKELGPQSCQVLRGNLLVHHDDGSISIAQKGDYIYNDNGEWITTNKSFFESEYEPV